jgi:hypothetical protein
MLIKLLVIAVYHKGFGPASDPLSLGLIRRELPSNETVEVRNTPVGLEVSWWWQAFCLDDVSPGRGGFYLRWGVERQAIDPLCHTKVNGRFMKVP